MYEIERQNKVRSLIQERAGISANNHNHLILNWSTGCGKTLASIKIIDEIIKKDPSKTGYIVCKETTHRANWVEDIMKHGYDHIFDNVIFILYASYKKMTERDFYVFDECHALTNARVLHIKPLIKPETKVLYLSATIPKDKRMLIDRIARYTAKQYKITLLNAIKIGLLPPPTVYIHRKKLGNSSHRPYKYMMKKGLKKNAKQMTCDYKDRWEVFDGERYIHLEVSCNQQEYYQLLSEQMEYHGIMSESGKPEMREMHRNLKLNTGIKRKNFLAEAKTNKAKYILKRFRENNNRLICFTGTIEQAMSLGSSSAVHSKNKKDINKDLIRCFNEKECNELFAVKMLRESVNLVEIEKGLVIQLDSTIGSFYQMLGRCLRHEFPEIHLIIIEDTQDEVYFASAMKDFDKKFVKEYGK